MMRPTVLLAGLIVTGGISVSQGIGTVEDTISWEMSGLVAGRKRHTHDAPHPGRLLSMRWLTLAAGADGGASAMTLEVRRSGVPICSLPVPCASAPATDVPAAVAAPTRCDVELAEGDHLEVVPLDDGACSVLPTGVISATFFWE